MHGRNGARLAVETINASGGVAGRRIELLVRDDGGTPEGARAADLKGREDCFFRVTGTTTDAGSHLGRYIVSQRGITRMYAVYDSDNAAFTISYLQGFLEAFHASGGRMICEESFSSSAQPDFFSLPAGLRRHEPQGLLILASPVDTALIAQRIRQDGRQVPLFATGWSQTEALIQTGGEAVEGMEIVRVYNPNSKTPGLLEFQSRYRKRFGDTPSFAAAQGYEAVQVLAEALAKTRGKTEGLREALVETEDFNGLTDTISLDRYGDAVRSHFLLTVRKGQFVTLSELKAQHKR